MRRALIEALRALPASADELAELDSRLGDGDLGITVSAGAIAAAEILEHPEGRSAGELLSGAARAFGSANPSTFAALVQGALTAAGRAWVGGDERGATLGVLDQAIASIKKRGKAELGDKTVLDPLQASRDVLAAAARLDAGTLREMAAAAERTTSDLRDSPSRRGRASWLQERSIGQLDPGSIAYVRFLQALADTA